jgi:hypothetical protein
MSKIQMQLLREKLSIEHLFVWGIIYMSPVEIVI